MSGLVNGLQNRVRRFESARHLSKRTGWSKEIFTKVGVSFCFFSIKKTQLARQACLGIRGKFDFQSVKFSNSGKKEWLPWLIRKGEEAERGDWAFPDKQLTNAGVPALSCRCICHCMYSALVIASSRGGCITAPRIVRER